MDGEVYVGGPGEFEYVDKSEASDEDRVTVMDKLAIVGAVAMAQLIRLFIIFAAVGIIILIIFIGSHVIPK